MAGCMIELLVEVKNVLPLTGCLKAAAGWGGRVA